MRQSARIRPRWTFTSTPHNHERRAELRAKGSQRRERADPALLHEVLRAGSISASEAQGQRVQRRRVRAIQRTKRILAAPAKEPLDEREVVRHVGAHLGSEADDAEVGVGVANE